ncbi:MAG: hemin-degrading factor [Luteibaculaceae bacterium]
MSTLLKEKWAALKAENPTLRIRNAAEALKTTEEALLATQIGESVTFLGENSFRNILKSLEALGKVMALSRNESVVHERKGVYTGGSITDSPVGLFVGEDIDLRIFFSCWKNAYAVKEPFKNDFRYSLQFFSTWGEALHKIYLTPHSNLAEYEKLVTFFQTDATMLELGNAPKPAIQKPLQDAEIDALAFQKAWREMTDTHQFFSILKTHNVARHQAMRLAPEGNFVCPVEVNVIKEMLQQVAAEKQEIMVFVGNPGMIQIHTGPCKKLLEMNAWYNVMDPDFNLHINMDNIVHTYIVRKPTEDGTVTSVECYDANEELVVQFFGKRKPGIPEKPEWAALCEILEKKCALGQTA